MKKIIAHRANLFGPDATTENRMGAIKNCLASGYDVEIDVQAMDGEVLYVGHDNVVDELDLNDLPDFINGERISFDRYWFHAKTMDALQGLLKLDLPFNVFWHQKDYCTLTSTGFIWCYPNPDTDAGPRNIWVMPEIFKIRSDHINPNSYYAICTDYPKEYESLLND